MTRILDQGIELKTGDVEITKAEQQIELTRG